MRLLKRCTALFTCLGFAGATLFCVAPACAIPASATSQDAQIVFDAVTSLAFETFTDPGLTQEEVAVISAQAGLAYWYAAVTDASTWNTGNARIFSGFCQDTNGNTYFGSASINDDASTMYGDIADSNNNHVSVSYTLADRTNLPYTRTMVPNEGFGATGGQRYTISTNNTYVYAWQYDGEFSGDPFEGWFIIGSSPLLRDARFKRPEPNNCGMLFYSGGFNLSGTDFEPTGDFLDDFETLQDDLHETYPDVDPDYYVNIIIVDPSEPTDPTEATDNCNCVHNIYIEPTINVEVNVEPTVNVEVNVDNPLPSEWLETIPTESTENPLEELPTLDVENFTDILQDPEDTFPEASGFWWEAFERWIKSNERLWKYFLGLFTIAVVGFIIRKLG